jgi:hypothetical protein
MSGSLTRLQPLLSRILLSGKAAHALTVQHAACSMQPRLRFRFKHVSHRVPSHGVPSHSICAQPSSHLHRDRHISVPLPVSWVITMANQCFRLCLSLAPSLQSNSNSLLQSTPLLARLLSTQIPTVATVPSSSVVPSRILEEQRAIGKLAWAHQQ